MHISPMVACEVDAIGTLAKAAGFNLQIAQELARSFAHIWVARLDAETANPDAFLLAWQAADELDVIALGTAERARRQGLAGALVAELLRFAVHNHVCRVILEVRCSNQAALRLYRSRGFQVGRLRENYYSEPTEDGLEMSLAIDEAFRTTAFEDFRRLEACE